MTSFLLHDVFDPTSRLAVAMSGGVDSSVAAWMLREDGHPLVGLFMRNGVAIPEEQAGKKSCCSAGDARDARMVAAALDIPFQAVDLKREFGELIRHFVAEYQAGRTPNPCALCNRDLKFDALLECADAVGAAGVATGHYARVGRVDGRVAVRRGVDRAKDQSYQLFAVREEHLERTRLPLGELTKPQVRELAERAALRTAKKADSQEICFVPGNDYRRLLAERGVEFRPGPMVDTAGRALGTHDGIERYTIGQRRGLGIATGTPMYVVDLLVDSATVVLGPVDACASRWLELDGINWIGVDAPASGHLEADVQVRYHHSAAPADVHVSGARVRVEFKSPQLAVAAGQGAALYRGDRLIGGGWIARAERPPRVAPNASEPSAREPEAAPAP